MKASTFVLGSIMGMLVSSTNVYAGELNCTGTDEAGGKLAVVFDKDNNKITVNGQVFDVLSPSKDEKPEVVVVSKPYDTNEYGPVYITLAPKQGAPGHMVISQVAVKDHAAKSTVELVCK